MGDAIVGAGAAMGRLTATDFVQLGLKSLGNPAMNWDEDDQLTCVNLAVLEIVSKSPLSFPQLEITETFDTEASTSTYELDSVVLRVHDVFPVGTSQGIPPRLEKRDLRWYTDQGRIMASGPPIFWMDREWGSTGKYQIQIVPTPDAVYNLQASLTKVPSEVILEPEPNYSPLPQVYDQEVLHLSIKIALGLVSRRDETLKHMALAAGASEAARGARPRASEKLWKIASIAGRSTK